MYSRKESPLIVIALWFKKPSRGAVSGVGGCFLMMGEGRALCSYVPNL